MNEKISMTLSELENYIDSKSNNKFIYTYENNDLDGIRMRIVFDAVTVSLFTRRLVFWDSEKGCMTDNNSNYLYIDSIDNIIVEHILSSCDAVTIISNSEIHKREYVILYDYDN